MKKLKKLITVVMTIVMLITIVPLSNYEVKAAEAALETNTVTIWQGETWKYTLDSKGRKLGTTKGNDLGTSFTRENATANISEKTLSITAKKMLRELIIFMCGV